MTANGQFSRTVRIAIPLQVETKVPRVAKKKDLARTTSWIVTQTEETTSDRYQELLHSLYDGVLITKASGRIVDMNARAMSLLLYDKDELSRLNVMNIITGANEQLLDAILKNIENNRFTLIDAYCLRKNKTTFPAEIATNRLVLTKEGHLCFFLRDVTRRKKVEEELIQTVSKLKELDNAKSRLVANVSHELRTPLTIISSFVSLVHNGIAGTVTDQQKECLATVLRNCERLANLIDDVLDLGSIESGREEFKRHRLNLVDLLKQCHHDFLPRFLCKRQQLSLQIPQENFPDVLGDQDKIAQVITNLVGNAHKFAPEGGGEVNVILSMAGENARVDVIDNGPGISPENQLRLFEAFTHINQPESDSGGKNTGLGLTISRHIVEAHEGILNVESEPGKGSRFYFTLPLYNEQKAFDAFIGDRSNFMQAHNRRPVVVLAKYCAGNNASIINETLSRQLQAAVASALGCSESHVFLLESESSIFALTDRADISQKTFTSRLQAEIKTLIRDSDVSISYAYFQPDIGTSPSEEWLRRAKDMLQPLPAALPGKARRILIVDDEESVLKMIMGFLGEISADFDIQSTTSGYDACIRFGNWQPDLVVLDLHLPDIDGRKVFESMRKGSPKGEMKFLAVSGYHEDIQKIMELGCDDCLPKPFDFESFSAKIESLLGK